MGQNVVAIDLGYGHVKAKTSTQSLVFPSFVTPVVGDTDVAGTNFGRADVVTVKVGSRRYTAGKDSELTMTAHMERNRDASYASSEPYLALMRVAFWYLRMETIDLLVVGLPMSTFHSNQKQLVEILEGTHEIPRFQMDARGVDGETTTVTVRKVLVLPQAVGALFSAAAEDQSIRNSRAMVLDLGFHTLDVLCSASMRPLSDRKGAVPGGMAGFIDALQSSLSAEVTADVPTIRGNFSLPSYLYEGALRGSERKIAVSSGTYSLEPHIVNAQSRLIQYLDQASTLTRGYSDMQVAVLAGGGASLLEPVIRDRFPGLRNIVMAKDPQMAIANGYLICGEDMLDRIADHVS